MPAYLEALDVGAPKRGESHRPHLDGSADVVNLLDRDVFRIDRVVDHEAENARVGYRDARPPAIADVDQGERGKGPERFAHDRAGDAKGERQRSFARYRRPGLQIVGADQSDDRSEE